MTVDVGLDPVEQLTKDITVALGRWVLGQSSTGHQVKDLFARTLQVIEILEAENWRLETRVESLENAENEIITKLKAEIAEYRSVRNRDRDGR